MGKILKNATAVFFIVIISLFAGTFFFLKANRNQTETVAGDSRKSSLSQRQYLNGDAPEIEVTGSVKGEAASDEPASTPPAGSTVSGSLADSSKDIKDQSAEEIRENLESQLFRKDSSSAAKDDAAPTQYKLHIYFAEVSSKGMDMLFQEARITGQMASTDFSQGVVNMPMTKILSYREDFSVYSEITKNLEKGKSTEWFQGLKSAGPDGDVGITHTITLKDSPNGRLQLDVKISKRFQVGGNETATKNYQVTDYIGGGEVDIEGNRSYTFFAAEILSKYPMTAQQEYLTAISPFEIYKSQNFAGGKTFSVFFYTVENK
jgi:hypothetical protein